MEDKEKDLTNYDKYLLKKEKQAQKSTVPFADVDSNPDYLEYLKEMIRADKPREGKVLTLDEYRARNAYESAKEPPARVDGRGAAAQARARTGIKKFGFLFLGVYVIIVTAIALIVLTNTFGGSKGGDTTIPGAGAEQKNEETVQAMPLEEPEPESENWFDKLCDSLNKK